MTDTARPTLISIQIEEFEATYDGPPRFNINGLCAEGFTWWIAVCHDHGPKGFAKQNAETIKESIIIREQTGLTPRQLLKQRDDTINRLQQTAFANSSLTVENQKLLDRVRELEAARDALEFQLRDSLTAVKWKSPPVDFGTWEGLGDANYCWEARVPVAFVDNAEAALAKHGGGVMDYENLTPEQLDAYYDRINKEIDEALYGEQK